MVPTVSDVAVGRMGIPVLQSVFNLMTGVQSGPSIADVCRQIGSLSAQLDERSWTD